MPDRIFEKGREGFADAAVDWNTDTINAALVDLATSTTGVKAITGATNASPIVITATSHGFSNGDLVVVVGVGGNLAANGMWKIANVATNTFELTDYETGANSTGSGTYTSGGYAICLGQSGSGDFWNDFSGGLKGTAQTIANRTLTNGVLDGDDVQFSNITNCTAGVVMIYKDTGTASTSRMLILKDFHQLVTCAATASSGATSIAVERLVADIASGTQLAFSNGTVATLSAAASAGARTISVNALGASVTAGSRAAAPYSGGLINVGASATTVTITWDNGPDRIVRL